MNLKFFYQQTLANLSQNAAELKNTSRSVQKVGFYFKNYMIPLVKKNEIEGGQFAVQCVLNHNFSWNLQHLVCEISWKENKKIEF